MKRAIFDRNLNKVKQLVEKYKKQQFSRQNLELFIQIPTSKEIYKIFKYLTKHYCLQGQERVIQITKYFTGKKLQINPLQTTIDFRYRYRDQVDLEKQQKNLSQAERFMLLIYRNDISDRQSIINIIILQKIKQKKFQFSEPKMILRTYVNLIQNIFTTKQQILYIFQKTKQLLEIKQWNSIPQQKNQLEIFIKAWQIRKKAAQKLQLDLTYQFSFCQQFLNVQELKKLETYQKKMYMVYEKKLKELQNSKQKFHNKDQSQIQLIQSQMYKQIEKQYIEILKKQKNLSILYKLYLELKLNNQISSQKILQKLSQFKMIRKTKNFLGHYQSYSINKIVINQTYWENIDNLLLLQLNSFNYCFDPNNFLIIFFLTQVLQKSKICIKKGDKKTFNQLKKNYQKFIQLYTELIQKQHNYFIGFNLIQILDRQIFYFKKQFINQFENMLFLSQITLYHKFFYKFQENFFHQFTDYCFTKIVNFMRFKNQNIGRNSITKQIQGYFCGLVEEIIIPTLEKYYKSSTQQQKKYQLLFLSISFKIYLKIMTIQQALQNFQIIIQEIGLMGKNYQNIQMSIQFIHKIHRFISVLYDKNLQRKYNMLNEKIISIIENYLKKQNNNYQKLAVLIANLNLYYTINRNKQKLYLLIMQKLKISYLVFDISQIYVMYLSYFEVFVQVLGMEFQVLRNQFYFFMEIIGKRGGLQQFSQNYGQSIIFCQLFLRYFYCIASGNKNQINYAIKIINIGRMLINHNLSSFFNSRFKIITSIISQKFIIKILFPDRRRNRRRYRMAVLKVLRNKQFSFFAEIQTLLKISQKFSELNDLHLCFLQKKIKKIYMNKTLQIKNINNPTNQIQLIKLLNQSQIDFMK